MSERVLGYVLIVVGLIVIIFTAVNIYFVFTKKSEPVTIFNLPSISIDMSNLVGSEATPEQVADLKQSGKLKTELISSDVLNRPMNLIAHILLMSFMLNVGFKISSLGINLVRPIKVNLREEKSSDSKTPLVLN
ncbi:hypothetical protein A2955_01845 [Candidatus Woesebacteria bacterium RIFCSPLOWO2_01_FULL_37_19]|uniref:Uncharacterized protein n=2 Tax=Candidatus Woeseibacteriota TaxID=1752722 RepID=A0A1F8AYB3_9BACT|nr:MAG: hypothetical protein A2771_01785 [Candidatus Woesebacteria bacterium RIFCSPHIGHO2_01_FULL_38_26b]OGM56753.1 MAG: hypothetical protein A2955_01845 [Candidatus Woesebacteria bacterium RIFCSPLOWO2_01_FULL_37_19]